MTDKEKTLGCGIEFPHFGGGYPDAKCIDGYLWDMDSWNGEGFTIGGDDPCPICNEEEWLEWVLENETFKTKEEALEWRNTIMDKYLD